MPAVLSSESTQQNIQPLFETEEEYSRYREDFSREMEPVLEEQRRARVASEEAIRRKVIR